MTADISRIFADRNKHYSSVVRQQGRLPTDAEENHAEAVDQWLEEARFTDTISPLGSPDNGFKVVLADGVDDSFMLMAGSMYVGGARIENADALAYADQKTSNWLTMDLAADAIAAGERTFVWLEAEERLVTAVEDGELLEPALRGPDGAAMKRWCWRVRQARTDADTCHDALDALGLTLDEATGAVEPGGTLAVDFSEDGADLDLCKPATGAGYLGDRNATFRIKVTGANRFVWSEDNASHLFRVLVDQAGGTIRFLTHPRDEWQRPKAGDTVELLRGDVALPNEERLAERSGLLLRATSGYADGQLSADMAAVAAWLGDMAADAAFDSDAPAHLYLRLWNGGGAGAAPDHGFSLDPAADPEPLGSTGITVRFAGAPQIGESWTFSARPDSPTRVLPWAMHGGMPAHAPRRHVVPLALADLREGRVKDCRPRFRPLHKLRSCCTITVGDGEGRTGDTASIAEAIDMLPDEGGTICLLPGRHVANVFVKGRANIRFSGCAGLTFWSAEDETLPLLSLIDCQDISVSEIAMEAGVVPAILAAPTDPRDRGTPNGGLVIEKCEINAPLGYAVSASGQRGARMTNCVVLAGPYPALSDDDDLTGHSSVFLQGRELVVEDCQIDATRGPGIEAALGAVGGVQIGGGSVDVTIRRCEIVGGHGTGIVLGSVSDVTRKVVAQDVIATMTEGERAEWTMDSYDEDLRGRGERQRRSRDARGFLSHAMKAQYRREKDEAGCIIFGYRDPAPKDVPDDASELVMVSDGELEGVFIEKNRIGQMGQNGIATYPLLPITSDGQMAEDGIAVEGLLVANNLIMGCVANDLPQMTDLQRLLTGFGGIALQQVMDGVFRENRIEDNGLSKAVAVCGISVLFGEALRFEDNLIYRNGTFEKGVMPDGPNSAVDLKLVTGGLASILPESDNVRGADHAALSMQGNALDAPAGRALRALAIGPVQVTGNRFTGGNQSGLLADIIGSITGVIEQTDGLPKQLGNLILLDKLLALVGGDCVHLTNLGLAEDMFYLLLGPNANQSDPTQEQEAPGPGLQFAYGVFNIGINTQYPPFLQRGGETMFNGNQTSLRRAATVKGEDNKGSALTAEQEKQAKKASMGTNFAGSNGFAMESGQGFAGVSARQPVRFDNLGSGGGSISSVFIATLDDLSFASNQCEVEAGRLLCLIHAILFGATNRVHGCRVQDSAIGLFSLAAGGLRFCNVYHNQTTLPNIAGALFAAQSRVTNNVSTF